MIYKRSLLAAEESGSQDQRARRPITLRATSCEPGGASAANLPLYFSRLEWCHRSAHVESMLSVKEAADADDTSRAAATARTACIRPAILQVPFPVVLEQGGACVLNVRSAWWLGPSAPGVLEGRSQYESVNVV